MLSACASGGFTLEKADVDPTILTSAAGPEAASSNTDQLSDQATIRNAVSAADVESVGAAPLRWANPETGSRGTISELAEIAADDSRCRRFKTSRERFDGVALFRGEICRVGPEIWRVQAFEAL